MSLTVSLPAAALASDPLVWVAQAQTEVCLCGLGAQTDWPTNAAPTQPAKAAPSFNVRDSAATDRANEAPADCLIHLLTTAVDEALSALPPDTAMGCLIGVAEPRPGLPRDLHGLLIGTLDVQRPDVMVNALLLPRGRASGLMALQVAAQQIALGETGLCLVAGVDSLLDPQALRWLEETGRLRPANASGADLSSQPADGLVAGEAGVACLLASRAEAARHGLNVQGRVLAAVTTRAASGGSAQAHQAAGATFAQAIQSMLNSLRLPDHCVSAVYADLNGEADRAAVFAAVQQGLRSPWREVAEAVVTPASDHGDVGAASGLLLLKQATLAARHGPRAGRNPLHALLCASSDHGYRCAVLMELGTELET